MLAQLLAVIDAPIVTLALPAIQRGLGVPPVGLQWVLSGYALAFGGFLLLGGRLADLLGGRRVLIAGAGVFMAASLACGLAGSPGVLAAARAVEGLGAAMVAPAALALVLALLPEGAERNKALGPFGAVSGVGGATGVSAGGMLTSRVSWPLPESHAGLGHRRCDAAGAVTVTSGLTLLAYSVVTASSHGWASAATLGLLAGAGPSIGAFAVIDARSAAPLLPLSFLRKLTVTGANLAGLLMGAWCSRCLSSCPVYAATTPCTTTATSTPTRAGSSPSASTSSDTSTPPR